MNLKKGVPVQIGPIKGFVFGGRFRDYVPGTRRLVGVKMAAEIMHAHDISIPTEDFSVPDESDMQEGMISALGLMMEGNDIYVGCMGGIGRTGLFMGCMAKLMQDCANVGYDPVLNTGDPVLWVRGNYMGHAIETEEQQEFVRNFDTAPVLAYLEAVLAPEVVVKRVEVPQYPTLLEYMTWWITGGFMK